mmetsp:Transcript_17172/g.34408  ORF Transcript_17172/g.34408 Transcript_17172/m.34408 type:complete len:1012 (+) Transcript_17172:269-3304(+)
MMGRKRGRSGGAASSSSSSDPFGAATIVDPLSLTRTAISRMAATSDLIDGNNTCSAESSKDCNEGIQPGATICADPTHLHSFQSTSTFFSFASIRSCGVCGGRLGSFFGGSADASSGDGGGGTSSKTGGEVTGGKLVRCLACGIYAHRRCAFRNYAAHCALIAREKDGDEDGEEMNCSLNICTANRPLVDSLDAELGFLSKDSSDDEAVVVTSCASDSDGVENADLIVLDAMQENEASRSGSESAAKEDSESVVAVDTEQTSNSFLSRIGWGSGQVSPVDEAVVAHTSEEIDENNGSGEIINGEDDTGDEDETGSDESDEVADDDNNTSSRKEISAHNKFDGDSDKDDAVWTETGLPTHWSTDEKAEGRLRALSTASSKQPTPREKQEEVATKGINDDPEVGDGPDEQGEEDAPIVPSAQPFSSVARALHENILTVFLGKQQQPDVAGSKVDKEPSDGSRGEAMSEDDGGDNMPTSIGVVDHDSAAHADEVRPAALEDTTLVEPAPSKEEVAGMLTELDPKAPPPPPPPPPSTFATTLEVVKATRRTRSNMGVASVAGGIVGGVAGLALAGPAGAVLLSKVCQTAGVLSVLLDGTMSIGVLVAGAAAAKFAAEQVAQGGSRMLALGGGTKGSRAVMLVRPNVVVDPIWGELCDNAKRSHPKVLASTKRSVTGGGFLAHHQAKVADMAKVRRNEVDADIVNSDEYEIATEDKLVLIVSRSLNDRLSLPGHVYSKLVQEHKDRAEKRKSLLTAEKAEEKTAGASTYRGDNDTNDDGNGESSEGEEPRREFSRARRQDAHGVIKYVTATLLEVRPGLGATSRFTELTASAVEGLVFGELYDSVFEEICDETKATDDALMTKMYEFEMDHHRKRRTCMELSDGDHYGDCMEFPISDENISVEALEALLSLSETKSPVDKLNCCVSFLEAISVHFDNAAGGGKAVSADYLLKMVCEHIIVAKAPRLNAELAFLEEFARDEHLLRGKEGYSLVTLQASLHFLNASKDFDADIFKNEY